MSSSDNKDYIQDILGVRDIKNGLIFTDKGEVLGIIEILPINYDQKSLFEKNSIIESYHGFFRICPRTLHFKTITEKTDVSKLIANIRQHNEDEKDPRTKKILEDYITNILSLQKEDTVKKRFFFIYEYEGDIEGNKSNDIRDITDNMYETRMHLTNVFRTMGHYVITPNDYTEATELTTDILYHCFNPKSVNTESLYERAYRIQTDAENILKETGTKVNLNIDDFIAPRGYNVLKPNHVILDGVYQTFLCIKDNGYPEDAAATWVNLLDCGLTEYTGLDIISKKLNRDRTISVLQQYNRWNRVSARQNVYKQEKAEELWRRVNNVKYITDSLKNNDEDIWDTLIIITVKGNTLRELRMRKNTIIKKLSSQGIYLEDAFLTADKYMRMTFPFLNINKEIWMRNKRNMLSTGMAHLYNFNSYEFYDDTGIVVGRNIYGNTLAAFNNFNTKFYANANMCIIGTSGAGKTFTEQMFAYRMRLTGIRCFFVLPVKGYEYRDGCKAIGGEYISLYPGADTCINIMQIRPEAKLKKDALWDKQDEDVKSLKDSLLVKKTVSITTFIQLLMGSETMTLDERNILNNAIHRLYHRFGISNDNDSIWQDKEHGIVKTMPVLKDLAIEMKRDPKLARIYNQLLVFVEGTCSNMNGQTNVNLHNPYTVFDVDEDNISEEYLPAFLYIAFDCAYDICKQNLLSRKAVFMDEVWKMMTNESCAKQVKKMVKLVRGYAASVILATQDIEDFLNSYGNYGAAVLNSTELKLFLKLKEEEIKMVAKVMDFDMEDRKKIKSLEKGTGLLYSNGNKVYIQFVASELEVETFTTDLNVKEYYAKKRRDEEARKAQEEYERLRHFGDRRKPKVKKKESVALIERRAEKPKPHKEVSKKKVTTSKNTVRKSKDEIAAPKKKKPTTTHTQEIRNSKHKIKHSNEKIEKSKSEITKSKSPTRKSDKPIRKSVPEQPRPKKVVKKQSTNAKNASARLKGIKLGSEQKGHRR